MAHDTGRADRRKYDPEVVIAWLKEDSASKEVIRGVQDMYDEIIRLRAQIPDRDALQTLVGASKSYVKFAEDSIMMRKTIPHVQAAIAKVKETMT